MRALALALLFATFGALAADVPYLSGRVVDDAEILSPAARADLAAKLKAHEDKTTNQVVVLTVPTIGSESIEEYANQVFTQWKLGQKGKDNGVLVVVAPKDRKMRIEVGYGLEGTLTDAMAARIIRNEMTPKFKNQDYDGGIGSGVSAIVALLETGAEPAADAPASSSSSKGFMSIDEDLPPWPVRILLGAFIFGIIPAGRVHLRHHRPLHRDRRAHARRGMVPVRLPHPVLGDVPDHGRRREGRAGAPLHVPRGVPARQARPEPDGLVREGEGGVEAEGIDHARRHGHLGRIELVGRRIELVVGQLVVGRLFRRRRQLGRRRLVRVLVARASGGGRGDEEGVARSLLPLFRGRGRLVDRGAAKARVA